MTAGAGLTGGGSSGTVTLAVGAGQGIQVAADSVALADGGVTKPKLSASGGTSGQLLSTNGSSLQWVDPPAGSGSGDITAVTAGAGLAGGGTTGDVSLSVANGGIATAMLADAAVTTTKLSPAGGASGKVLKSSGSAVVWGDDDAGGLTLPYTGSTSSSSAAFGITNTANGPALSGFSQTGFGVYGSRGGASGLTPSGSAGVWGDSSNGPGIVGTSSGMYGVSGECSGSSGRGIRGYASSSSGATYGVFGESNSTSGVGVYGSASATNGYTSGVEGLSSSLSGVGVKGRDSLTGNFGYLGTPQQGVYGENATSGAKGSLGSADYGVYGNDFGGSHAGYFNGPVHVNGTLTKAGGSFLIDHPLDPENRTLSHSFVESPDMMNVYNGNVRTDADGYATVTLPEWFEALNRDFRYQLTVIGQFAQAIVAEKVKDNRFVIRTNLGNVEVSWQVTGIRQDAWANAHRIPVEQDKPDNERGTYLNPEAFGKPAELGLEHLQETRMFGAPRHARDDAEEGSPAPQ